MLTWGTETTVMKTALTLILPTDHEVLQSGPVTSLLSENPNIYKRKTKMRVSGREHVISHSYEPFVYADICITLGPKHLFATDPLLTSKKSKK